jgi:hypothetical protein
MHYTQMSEEIIALNQSNLYIMALRKDLTRDIIAIEHIPNESASGGSNCLII